jgi:cell division protein ZapE
VQLSYNSKIFTLDKNQIIILKELKKLSNQLNKKDNFWHYLFKINNSKSLYIYGSVGRGKSMLMNYFFNLLKIEKSYFHFNDFMQKIHKNLHQIRIQNKNKDHILQITINKILKNSKILCLDEFQVYDIVDAMILSDIFKYIFKKKITVIFTSNSYPADLYKDGLQRQYFLQFINNIILKECKILNLDGYQDYRVQNNKSHSNFIYPINKYNLELFNQILNKHLQGAKMISWNCNIMGRNITLKNSYKNLVVIDFLELFSDNSGVVDYMKICKNFKFIFIKNIPALNNNLNNETKRFILFIDEAYENDVKLTILSQNSIDKIYENGLLYELFQRAASRLKQLTDN